LVTSLPVSLPIPHQEATTQDTKGKEKDGQERTRPTEDDLIKAYLFMIKEVCVIHLFVYYHFFHLPLVDKILLILLTAFARV
jgi:hypothetical protein